MDLARFRGMQGIRDARSFPLFLALGINAFGAGMFFPFALLYYQAATNLAVSTIGIALTSATLATLVANPIAGMLVDRFGPQRIVVSALYLEVAGFAAYLAVTSAVTLFAAALLATAGARMFFASFSTLIAEWVEDSDRDRWYGLVGITQNVGSSLSGLIASVVIGTVGLGGFRLIILVNICCLIVSALLIRASRPVRSVAPVPAGTSAAAGYRTIGRDRPFLLLVGSNLFFVLCSMLMGIGFVVYATEALGAPLWSLGVIGVVQTVLTVFMQTRITAMMRGVRRTRTIAVAGAIWLVAAMGFAVAIAVPVPVIVPYLFLVSVVFTTSQMFYGPASRALAAGIGPPEARGRYIATFELSWGIAAAATPATFGLLYSQAPVMPWLAMAGMVMVAVLLVMVAEPGISPRQNRPWRESST